MIKALIFYVGGVITKTDWKLAYTSFANAAGIPPEAVIDFHQTLMNQLLMGEMSFMSDFVKAMHAHTNKEAEELKTIWVDEISKLVKINVELLKIIDGLRKRYKLLVLSNLTESRLMIDEKLDLYSHFDQVFLSYKEHLKKPDEKFYRLALAAAKAEPAEAVFIDDTELHVAAAQEIGIHGIVYTDNASLKTDLSKLGISL